MRGRERISPAGFLRVVLGGTPVDLCDRVEFLGLVRRRLRHPETPLLVASANLDHIHHFGRPSTALTSPDWLSLLDGEPLTWMARRLTSRSWPRLAGSDLLNDLLELATELGCQVGFLGGRSEVHLKAERAVGEKFPALLPPAFWSPDRSDLSDPATCRKIADEIEASRVEILFVCLGKPRQENWIEDYGRKTRVTVQLAFGASVDFLAGEVPRAPSWMQAGGLEWLFRLSREPRRLGRRYLLQGPPALARLLLRSSR